MSIHRRSINILVAGMSSVIYFPVNKIYTYNMNRLPLENLLISAASGVFIGVVLIEILPEGINEIGITSTAIWFLLGVIIWSLLKRVTDFFSKNSLAIVSTLAFWFHSFLEGAITALSFSVSQSVGIAVAAGMILHLVPEFFAIVGILKGEGITVKKSVWIDVGGIVVLFTSFFLLYLFSQNIQSESLVPYEMLSGGAFTYIGSMSFLKILKRRKDKKAVVGLILGLVIVIVWRSFFL